MSVKKAAKHKKQTRGILNNLIFAYSAMIKQCPMFFLAILASGISIAVMNVITPFLSKSAVDIITDAQQRNRRICIFLGLLALQIVSKAIYRFMENYKDLGHWRKYSWYFLEKLGRKRMTMDYENVEKASAGDAFQKAYDAIEHGLDNIDYYTCRVWLSGILTIVTDCIVLGNLNPWLIPVTVIPSVFCFLMQKAENRWVIANTANWVPFDRKLNYIKKASADFARAKDVRIYPVQSWFERKYEMVLNDRLQWYQKQDRNALKWAVLRGFVLSLSQLFSYGYTIYGVYRGNFSAGAFVLYFSAIDNLSSAVFSFGKNLSQFTMISDYVDQYRDYLEIPDHFNYGEGVPLPRGECEIEFRDVSYRYPASEVYVIRNLSFTMHKGERLALVGLNGAGKSTLIKLMCGLYDPTEGEILLNGIPVKKYNRRQYYTLFSTVFQDFYVLPVTIAQNITQQIKQDQHDEADVIREGNKESTTHKIKNVLRNAGLSEKIDSLPKKSETKMAKSVFDDATDFSGGELQKLVLAKALYKDAPVLLLDEPTAALDPKAEHEMYLKYAGFTEGKTSVFISHRLASTKFCDRILFLENGQIKEEGTHQELLEKKGRYSELYALQSSYYQDGAVSFQERGKLEMDSAMEQWSL